MEAPLKDTPIDAGYSWGKLMQMVFGQLSENAEVVRSNDSLSLLIKENINSDEIGEVRGSSCKIFSGGEEIRCTILFFMQFSVTEHFRNAELGRLQSLPGVFFFYDLSPIKVTFTEEHVSFLHFLTNVCAIVGGVFTVSGILDSFIYHSQKAIKKKIEIGKFS
ncbi:Endoplasmic reticulum-Golgi intermediate compartment protein 3 [Vitis vinifera]|uniref:Endoplasmic reticulum-Golgi intermediate compartment protein 3 n=1 Tax=Vitis vinifera TaxID=29760 RepID=A0A438FZN4_VITVI|nr:Endoplasmic reticulum-Golgi intermediate compartment protein 3 [Vitis vinifera]